MRSTLDGPTTTQATRPALPGRETLLVIQDGDDAVRTVDQVLRFASERGASDVHLDPTAAGYRVRLRLPATQHAPGRLEEHGTLGGCKERIVGRLKSLAQLLVYRQDLPQEGCIARGAIEGVDEVRVSTYPAADGERVALRFQARAARGFEDLGLGRDVEAALGARLEAGRGVILVSGAAGSGKTTTLYACLDRLVKSSVQRSILSVEDPIERRVDGVVQTALHEAIGLDGPTALRSLLRQDPEVLMVGEIRDARTARLVLEAGLTGHLVLTSLHAGGPLEVLARLRGFGLEAFAIGHALTGIVFQGLVQDAGGARLTGSWLAFDDELRRAIAAADQGSDFEDLVRQKSLPLGDPR